MSVGMKDSQKVSTAARTVQIKRFRNAKLPHSCHRGREWCRHPKSVLKQHVHMSNKTVCARCNRSSCSHLCKNTLQSLSKANMKLQQSDCGSTGKRCPGETERGNFVRTRLEDTHLSCVTQTAHIPELI